MNLVELNEKMNEAYTSVHKKAILVRTDKECQDVKKELIKMDHLSELSEFLQDRE